MYIAYKCLICGMTFIIPTEDVKMIENSKGYIACNAGHKKIKELGKYDSIKECMDNHVFVREGRRMRQIK